MAYCSAHQFINGHTQELTFYVPVSKGPDLVRFDPSFSLLADVKEEKSRDLWVKQATAREASRLTRKYRLEGYSLSQDLAETISEAALENGIDLDIAFGLVRAESSFRTAATSPVGAVGLTQLMPSTARWIQPGVSRSALRDPETNLKVGFKYLRYLLEKYEGNEDLALLAYNRGPGTVDKVLKRGGNPDNDNRNRAS